MICQGGALGSMSVGSGPLGSAQLGGLFAAVAVDATTIDVATIPLASPFLLDPLRWTVVPVGLGDAQVVTAVVEVTSGVLWRLTVDPGLTLGELEYLVAFDDAGTGLSIGSGCLSVAVTSPEAAPVFPVPATQVTRQPYDIANPYLVRDAGIIDPPPLGQMQINDRGDYALDNRLEGLRKRIMRRISTARGGFALLPGYGFGQPIKGTVRPAELKRMAADAKAQVEREPEVIRAQVLVQQQRPPQSPHVVIVAVRARTTLGLDVAAAQAVDLRPQGAR